MNQKERHLEGNAARLIRAAYGPDARPDPQADERTFRLLLSHVRARPAFPDFPGIAMGLLGAIWAVLAVWLIVHVRLGGTSIHCNPSLPVIVVWLASNLVSMPIASILILTRRQNG